MSNSADFATQGSLKDYLKLSSTDLSRKADEFHEWELSRLKSGLWSWGKSLMTAPGTTASVKYLDQSTYTGVNFLSQDYLSLSSHPLIKEAAIEAIHTFGVHSAGSTALAGNVGYGNLVEQEVSSMLHMEQVILFPTGWSAGYGVCKALVRAEDYVVIDLLAHNCLQEGARSATNNVYQYRHLDVSHAKKYLARIRKTDTKNGILLITESLFSMDSDTPNIKLLQEVCHEYNATLLIDVAHDFGCMGVDGTGHIGLQGLLGRVDLVMGSFSKTFASNGGFVATKKESVKEYLRYYAPSNTFSNALSPIQIAIIKKALEIVRSTEGIELRNQLMYAVKSIRSHLLENGIEVMGNPSPIVPVMIGSEKIVRYVSKLLAESGVLVNPVEYPAVSVNTARLRLQLMSSHNVEICQQAANIIAKAFTTVKSSL
ncbi:aminotransferase class I/II-fold pyridoxal phosphate-dependent enzyme [Nostoc sp.]|uniref:aminotransferase class I/II-fold pyridoxal phosphate-dependent enzyme n=1 Tax=Nostoc sp. TaxID=1180 RepID=UPI002FFA9C05